jgi:hypothetical protein
MASDELEAALARYCAAMRALAERRGSDLRLVATVNCLAAVYEYQLRDRNE